MTQLKRVVVYFTDEEKQEIEAISKAMGESMSSLISDMFRQTLPHLRAVADAVTLAKTNPDEAVKMIRSAGYDSQIELLNELKGLDK
jgi:uncharacterized protein YybS (DUF2232 family)